MEKVPPFSSDDFTITVLIDDTWETEGKSGPGKSFRVQLMEKRAGGAALVAQVLRKWDSFVQFDLFARSIVPKLEPLSLPSPETATPEELRDCMERYLLAAVASPPLNRLQEVQDFTGYTTVALSDGRRRVESNNDCAHASAAWTRGHLRSVSTPLASLSSPPSKPMETSATLVSGPRSSLSCPSSFAEMDGSGADGIGAAEERMLGECFRIIDVGAAGYVTPDDMQEFFATAGLSPSSLSSPLVPLPSLFVERGRNEACNFVQFIAIVRRALRSGGCVCGIVEWIDRYWLLQHQKIFAATAAFVKLSSSDIPAEPLCGLDPRELATLLFVLTEAGIRLVSSCEVDDWFRARRHQRSCAIAMDKLSALLDALSNAVPFSETWRALLPREPPSQESQQIELIARYAALGNVAAAEELHGLIVQLQGAGAPCENCCRAEKRIALQTAQIAELTCSKERLAAEMAELEQELHIRLEALERLEDDHWDVLAQLANTRESPESHAPVQPHTNANTDATIDTNVREWAKELQLMPCGAVMSPCGGGPVVLSDTGALTYEIPPALRFPVGWTVDIFICSARDRAERLALCDTDGRRSCAFVFLHSELRVVGTGGRPVHSFYLATRRWYRLRCSFDWKAYTFRVTLTDGGKGVMTSSSSGDSFAMVDGNPSGVATVDAYPRTELFVSYCNFFIQYKS